MATSMYKMKARDAQLRIGNSVILILEVEITTSPVNDMIAMTTQLLVNCLRNIIVING